MRLEKEFQKIETAALDSLQRHSEFFLKMEMDSLRNYLPLLEKYTLNDSEKIEEILTQWNKTLPEEFCLRPEHLSQKLDNEKIQMSSLFRNSTFISCFSLLETNLSELCRNAKEFLRLPIEESGLKDKGIEGSKKYLLKSLDLKIADREEWEKLKLYQSVRNALVHNKGQAKTKSESSQIVKKLKGISKSADDYMYLSSDFIPNFLDILESFLNSIQTEGYKIITAKHTQYLD